MGCAPDKMKGDTISTMTDGQPRKKSELGRGYSLMDWVRYANNTPNLSGVQGILPRVTFDELSKHNKVDDCWMALNGKVYNVTPYIKYHPGGVDEIMRGAGIDATDLFNQVHPWVNFHGMLEKCFVGNYDRTKPMNVTRQAGSSNKQTGLSVPTVSFAAKPTVIHNTVDLENQAKQKAPAIDTYSTNEKLVLVIYTKWKDMSNEFIVIDKIADTNELLIDAYIHNDVYEYKIELSSKIKDNYDVKISNEGKTEITLYKIEDATVVNPKPSLFSYTVKQIDSLKAGINFRKCELVNRVPVTHDTDLYTFKLPLSCRMCIPCGQHILLRLENGSVVKPYTVVLQSLDKMTDDELRGRVINLMIKHYENGVLTSQLKRLQIGKYAEISNFMGTFDLNILKTTKKLICICAGSGFTPMVTLLHHALEKRSINTLFLFFNKKSRDIMWRKEIDEFAQKHSTKLEVQYILSDPEAEWTGLKGRINIDLLTSLVPKHAANPLFCICGSVTFNKISVELLKQFGIDDKLVHVFSA